MRQDGPECEYRGVPVSAVPCRRETPGVECHLTSGVGFYVSDFTDLIVAQGTRGNPGRPIMRKRERGPCALVAGDELVSLLRRGAVLVATILLWLGTFLLEGAELPALFAILAGAGISLDFGVRGSWVCRLHIRLSVAAGRRG